MFSLFLTFFPHFLSQVFIFGSSRLVVQDIILGIGSGDSEFTYLYLLLQAFSLVRVGRSFYGVSFQSLMILFIPIACVHGLLFFSFFFPLYLNLAMA